MFRLFLALLLVCSTSSFSVFAQDAKKIRDLSREQVPYVLKTAEKLVSIESGSRDLPGLAKILEVIRKDFADLGLETEVIATPPAEKTGSLLRVKLQGKGVSKIALIAHMDTVYQKGDLLKQPFRVSGNRAYGLGIADDKSGIAVILHVVQMIKTLKIDSFGELTILINADEEIGSPSSMKHMIKLGEENDLVISFEGSGVKQDYVRLATSSIARVNMTVKGRASHSGSSPENGRNALYELSHQILQTRDLSDPNKGLKLNWTQSISGTVPNMIPSIARATADVRANQLTDFDIIEATLNEKIKNKLIPDTFVTIEIIRGRPPMNPTAKSREAAELAVSIAKEIKWDLKALETATGGGTDAAYAALKNHAAVIESFGLQGYGAHSDDAEYVLISSIAPRLYITTRLIQSFKP